MGKNRRVVISCILIFLSVIYLVFVVAKNSKLFTERFNSKHFEKIYKESQWKVPNSKNPISDEELFTFAGYRYIKGDNPILINAETSPFAKYIVGLSILIFSNQRIASLIFAFLSLILIFGLVYKVQKNLFSASLAVFLTSFNWIFPDQIIHSPQLDIFQLFFLLLFLYLFYHYEKNGKLIFLIFSGFAAGAYAGSKTFFISIAVFDLCLVLYYFFKKEKLINSIKKLIIINFSAFLILILSYFRYFMLGGNLKSFFGVQKYIYMFYSHSSIQTIKILGSYLGLIFFNKYRYWGEGYPWISYQYWSILWPIIFIFGLFVVLKVIKSKKIRQQTIYRLLISWILIYNLFLFVIPIFPRYLLLLFIPMNILIAMYFSDKL